MHVIVTGASGFLGRNFLLRAPRAWQITALYYRTADLPAFIKRHKLMHVRAVRCDLLDAGDVQRLAAAGRADAVMYFAANGDPAA
jgi:nucleoside-diphosphate-sugar epimerase